MFSISPFNESWQRYTAVKHPAASQNSRSASLCGKQHPLRTEEDKFLLLLYKKCKDICCAAEKIDINTVINTESVIVSQ